MASIWQDIEIDFKGKTYKVRPSLAFINQIEQGHGNSIQYLYHRCSQGDVPTGVGVEVIYKTLLAADPKLEYDREDVLEETQGIGVGFTQQVMSILLACLPAPKETAATKNAKKKSGKSPRKKASTSGTSTE